MNDGAHQGLQQTQAIQVVAAVAAGVALGSDSGRVLDISMHNVARDAAGIASGAINAAAVAEPMARLLRGPAPRLAAYTIEVL